MDRKGFLTKACLAGVCGCGFGALSLRAENNDIAGNYGRIAGESQATQENKVPQQWLTTLLRNLDGSLEKDEIRKIVKLSSIVHFEDLRMDDMLSSYTGRLKDFLAFLETEWGWKINYNEATGVVLADENKSWCVCPVLGKTTEAGGEAICFCSEGFAELMFSKVTGVAVIAEVISSVRRGDKSCIYRIAIPV
jgi:hypothetical protein